MATIKSYTDIEQSKKLAKILPLESADMFHFIHEVDTVGFGYKKDAAEHYSKTEFEYLPCWSLAALLNILPKEINVLRTVYSINIQTKNTKWFIDYKCNNEEFVGAYSNIFVDACYEMIIRLHELNLL